VGYSVQERAEYVGTFRWVEIRLMRILAEWVPTTPEMEVKILFGRHLWDCAQHADALGKRAFELRAPLHYTLPAVAAYQNFLGDVAALGPTADRVAGFFEVVCPALVGHYRRYLDATDALMDNPTVRILENAVLDYARMKNERDRLVGGLALGDRTIRVPDWQARGQQISSIVEHGGENRRPRGVQA
jgi:hypothetical protein